MGEHKKCLKPPRCSFHNPDVRKDVVSPICEFTTYRVDHNFRDSTNSLWPYPNCEKTSTGPPCSSIEVGTTTAMGKTPVSLTHRTSHSCNWMDRTTNSHLAGTRGLSKSKLAFLAKNCPFRNCRTKETMECTLSHYESNRMNELRAKFGTWRRPISVV